IEIGLQGFRIWTEVRIRIKNLKTLAHVCFLLARKAATFTLSITHNHRPREQRMFSAGMGKENF
ncbi:MAG: hypothetical protein ABW172_01220, partial [Candidatus Binatia bacterium]